MCTLMEKALAGRGSTDLASESQLMTSFVVFVRNEPGALLAITQVSRSCNGHVTVTLLAITQVAPCNGVQPECEAVVTQSACSAIPHGRRPVPQIGLGR